MFTVMMNILYIYIYIYTTILFSGVLGLIDDLMWALGFGENAWYRVA